MFGKLFKPRAHYVFDYKPRYYNERKERLKQVQDKYRNDKDSDEDSPSFRLSKNNLKNGYELATGLGSDYTYQERFTKYWTILFSYFEQNRDEYKYIE